MRPDLGTKPRALQLGKNVLASVEKGQRVSVTGNHSVEPYVNRDGEAGLNNRVWASDVAASMQHNTVSVAPGVDRSGAGRDRGLEQQSPEQVAGDPAWQAGATERVYYNAPQGAQAQVQVQGPSH